MRLRTLLAAGSASIAGLASVNQVLRHRADDLPAPLSGRERTYDWRGFDVAYTEAGDPADPTVVLLHGIHAAASAHEFRRIFDPIAEAYHVLAPDVLGFGRSDRPAIVYDGSLYERLVTDFLAEETDSPIVVASSLSGSYAARAADEVDVAELVLISPAVQVASRNVFVGETVRSPLVGTALFNLLVSKPALRFYNRRDAYTDPGAIDEPLLEYQWLTGHQPNARFAPASFLGGYLNVDVDLGPALAALDVPVTLVWGRQAQRPPVSVGRQLAEAGDTRLVTIDDAKLLPHDQHPRAFLAALEPTLNRLTDGA